MTSHYYLRLWNGSIESQNTIKIGLMDWHSVWGFINKIIFNFEFYVTSARSSKTPILYFHFSSNLHRLHQ